MGQTIGDELETQNHMLDGMEGQVDAAANAMSTLKAKMKQLANNKEGGKLCAIAALSATLSSDVLGCERLGAINRIG